MIINVYYVINVITGPQYHHWFLFNSNIPLIYKTEVKVHVVDWSINILVIMMNKDLVNYKNLFISKPLMEISLTWRCIIGWDSYMFFKRVTPLKNYPQINDRPGRPAGQAGVFTYH